MAGRVEITVQGTAGQTAELRCFEELDADGNPYLANLRKARTTMQYTFARSQTVTWQPQFTYMGFRYALVVQWPGKPEPANFTACVLHSAMQPAGEFTCSEPLVNQLNHNILWGLKSNFLDVPTDCPQRDERLGWTGDAQIFCETACWLADTWTFYSKWLKDLAVDQLPDGGVANVVPNIEETHTEANWLMKNCPYGASGWGDAATVIPWVLYQMYGDDTILRSQYPSMKRWVDFMRANTQNGLFDFKMQLGDWVALDAEPGSYFGATPTALTSQAYYALSAQLLALAGSTVQPAGCRALRGGSPPGSPRFCRKLFYSGWCNDRPDPDSPYSGPALWPDPAKVEAENDPAPAGTVGTTKRAFGYRLFGNTVFLRGAQPEWLLAAGV